MLGGCENWAPLHVPCVAPVFVSPFSGGPVRRDALWQQLGVQEGGAAADHVHLSGRVHEPHAHRAQLRW